MSRSLVRRAAVLFVLCVLLAARWSTAAPRQDHKASSPTAIGQLWSQLLTLWSDIGCGIDPDGRCHSSATPQSDIGCGIDPHGSCHSSAATQGDIGCIADPDGRCRSAAATQGDIGCILDPSGRCGR
jgi:hypothetical protein